jgi:hypothetical protein
MAYNNINPVASQGLSGLPHFRASRVSTSMWEPVYQNLFNVQIQLPDALKDSVPEADKDLLLEGLQTIGGLDTNKVPGASATQHYKFAERRFADAGPENTFINVTMDFEINVRNSIVDGQRTGNADMYTLKILRKWNDLIYDPLTGRMGLKAEYVAPQVVITMHDKANQPFWQWTLYHVWPTVNLPAPNLNYMTKSELYKVTGYTLACDYWDEAML